MLEQELENILIHDLKNPLTAVMGTAELFSEHLLGDLTDEQMKQINVVRAASKIMLNILADFQDANDLENGTFALNKVLVPINDLRQKLDWLVRYAAEENKKIDIRVAGVEAVPADKNVLARILETFLLNALKQTAKGSSIVLSIENDKNFVKFQVFDSGNDLPGEFAARVFDKDFKIEHPKFRSEAGTGLGFYFCQKAVVAHGGRIEAKSGAGAGLKITFYLPNGGKQ